MKLGLLSILHKWLVLLTLWGLIIFQVVPMPSSSMAQTNDYLIVPGQRLGRWELGKPLSAYDFGQPRSHTEQKVREVAWDDLYTVTVGPERLDLWVYTCKTDSLVFALLVARPIGGTATTEATKYRTAEGIGIGTDEAEVLRVLGQPTNAFDSRATVGQTEVPLKIYDYPGLRLRVPQTDYKVHALGAATRGGFAACQQAALGSSPQAAPPPSGVKPNLNLPVPMPADLRITPPGADVPPDRAKFSGIWLGKWNNVLDSALAVEEIKPTGVVKVVYAYGTALQWNITKPGWWRPAGRFAQNELYLTMGQTTATYRMLADGLLSGSYGNDTTGTFRRVYP